MQKKKELLKIILTKLVPYRDEANDFLLLIDSQYATPELIDLLILKFSQAIKTSKQKSDQKTMLKGLEVMKRIRELEEKDSISEKNLDLLLEWLK